MSEERISDDVVRKADEILSSHAQSEAVDEIDEAVERHAEDPAEAPNPQEVIDRVRDRTAGAQLPEYRQDPQLERFAQDGVARMQALQKEWNELEGADVRAALAQMERDDPAKASLWLQKISARKGELQQEATALQGQLQQASSQALSHFWTTARQHIPGWRDEKTAAKEYQEIDAYLRRYGADLNTTVAQGGMKGLQLAYDSWQGSKPREEPKAKKGKKRQRSPTGQFTADLSPREQKLERNYKRALREAGGEENVRKSRQAQDRAGHALLRDYL